MGSLIRLGRILLGTTLTDLPGFREKMRFRRGGFPTSGRFVKNCLQLSMQTTIGAVPLRVCPFFPLAEAVRRECEEVSPE